MKFIYCLAFMCVAAISHAQTKSESQPVIEDLRWVDEGYLQRQREMIDEMARFEFGQRIRGDIGDIRTINRILEKGLIGVTEKQKLQALGVVLGDVYVNELKMQWRVYQDHEGKSRAVCLPKTQHCLFPITMISRRIEAGASLDANDIYEKGVNLIKPYIPKLPYSKD